MRLRIPDLPRLITWTGFYSGVTAAVVCGVGGGLLSNALAAIRGQLIGSVGVYGGYTIVRQRFVIGGEIGGTISSSREELILATAQRSDFGDSVRPPARG